MYTIKMSEGFWRALDEHGIITDFPPGALNAYRTAQANPWGSGNQRIITGTYTDLRAILDRLYALVDEIDARKRRACDFAGLGAIAIRRYARQFPVRVRTVS